MRLDTRRIAATLAESNGKRAIMTKRTLGTVGTVCFGACMPLLLVFGQDPGDAAGGGRKKERAEASTRGPASALRA